MRKTELIVSLQIVRAIAAMMVVMSHVLHKHNQYSPQETHFLDWFSFGGYGVDIFFVMSGFIIPYIQRDAASRLWSSCDFMVRRIIRIMPLYWLFTLLALAVWLVAPGLVNSSAPGATRVWQSFLLWPSDGRYLVQTGWTLAYEMYVYLLFSVAMLAGHRRGVLFVVVLLASSIAGVILAPQAEHWGLLFVTRHHFFEFVSGFTLYHLLARRIGSMPRLGWMLIAAGGGMILLQSFLHDQVTAFLQFWGIPAVAIVAGALLVEGRVRWPSGLVHLGDASYSLYLIHPFVVALLAVVWYRLVPVGLGANVAFTVLCVAASIAVALLAYRMIELPSTRGLNAAWKAWRTRCAPSIVSAAAGRPA